jgi:hypothetical protein
VSDLELEVTEILMLKKKVDVNETNNLQQILTLDFRQASARQKSHLDSKAKIKSRPNLQKTVSSV